MTLDELEARYGYTLKDKSRAEKSVDIFGPFIENDSDFAYYMSIVHGPDWRKHLPKGSQELAVKRWLDQKTRGDL